MPDNTDLQVNTAVPENTAMPMFLTSWRQKCTFGNMVERELLCVKVATLLRNELQAY